jgi:hypothetical protein
MAAFIRGDERVIGTPAFAEQFLAEARAASREVPARERRTGTPALVEILARALQDGDGLSAGVRRARETGGYALTDIARCAGVSEGTVRRMILDRPPIRKRSGTRQRRILDLTPPRAGSET